MTTERRLAARLRLSSTLPDNVVTRRKGTVTAVNAGPPKTVDIDLGGEAVAGVAYLFNGGWVPLVGDVVLVEVTVGGDPIVIDRFAAAAADSWVSYTPVLKFGATAITVGNGGLGAFYLRQGKLVVFEVSFSWGTTSNKNGGAGELSFTLPLAVASAGAGSNIGQAVGQAGLLQAGTARTSRLVLLDADTAPLTRCVLVDDGFGLAVVSDTAPFTFAQTSNGFMASGSYRSA